MRIDPKTTVVTPVVAKTVRDAAVPTSEREESATVVELSSAAASAGAAGSKSDAASEASAAKVSRLREAIMKGDYKVDLDLLAARICEDEILGRSNQ